MGGWLGETGRWGDGEEIVYTKISPHYLNFPTLLPPDSETLSLSANGRKCNLDAQQLSAKITSFILQKYYKGKLDSVSQQGERKKEWGKE
ncbi:MAG: hypothetical protein F6K58_14910 [Symploca sp. SIO2E9]|nr:hypothetical protein [Symploca sp. SIO2E9]